MEQWKKVCWSDESCFPLHHVDGWVRVRCLPREVRTGGCTMWRMQVGGGSVILWAKFCWESLGPGIHIDVTLTCTTYQNSVADQVHHSIVFTISTVSVASFSGIMDPDTLQKLFRNGLKNMTMSSKCWLCVDFFQTLRIYSITLINTFKINSGLSQNYLC